MEDETTFIKISLILLTELSISNTERTVGPSLREPIGQGGGSLAFFECYYSYVPSFFAMTKPITDINLVVKSSTPVNL